MYKNATYKEKFSDLDEWMSSLIEVIKKDLRNEHLKKDWEFVKRFIPSKNIHRITTEEMAQAYRTAIAQEENGEELAEFMAARWLLKHGDLYHFFEKSLSAIHPDFASLEILEEEMAQQLIESAIAEFGARNTYLFSVLNSVVFPSSQFASLQQLARDERAGEEEKVQQQEAQADSEQMKQAHAREMARVIDRYESKLAGLQKKYIADVDSLKKQVAQLQRKLQGQRNG